MYLHPWHFLRYEVTSTKYTRDVYKELLISLVASLFMGFGVLFLLLWVGIYVWKWVSVLLLIYYFLLVYFELGFIIFYFHFKFSYCVVCLSFFVIFTFWNRYLWHLLYLCLSGCGNDIYRKTFQVDQNVFFWDFKLNFGWSLHWHDGRDCGLIFRK